jgi:ketosteroid isomerase-like protein
MIVCRIESAAMGASRLQGGGRMAKATEQLVQELLDREAIRDLPRRYCHYVWTNDVEAMLGIFTADGVLSTRGGGAEAAQEIRGEALRELYAGLDRFKPRPYIHNHVVELLGPDTAKGTCYVELRRETRAMDWIGTGFYDDEYVKEAGAWKFKARRYHAVTGSRPTTRPVTTDEERRSIAEGWIRLARTRDPSLLQGLLSEDVVWTLPGASTMSGEVRGRDGVAGRLAIVAGSGVHIDLRHVLYGWDDVAILMHNTGERDGRRLDEHLITLLRLRDGKIHRAETLVSDVPMLNAFFV